MISLSRYIDKQHRKKNNSINKALKIQKRDKKVLQFNTDIKIDLPKLFAI